MKYRCYGYRIHIPANKYDIDLLCRKYHCFTGTMETPSGLDFLDTVTTFNAIRTIVKEIRQSGVEITSVWNVSLGKPIKI